MDLSFEIVESEQRLRLRVERIEREISQLIDLMNRMMNLINPIKTVKQHDDAIITDYSNCSGSVLFG
jgi:hypothetical protein